MSKVETPLPHDTLEESPQSHATAIDKSNSGVEADRSTRSTSSSAKRVGVASWTGGKRTASIILLVVLSVIAIAVAIRFTSSPGSVLPSDELPDGHAESSASPLPVQLIRVGSLTDQAFTQRYAGLLRPKRESALSFERGGRVTRILVREGAMVSQGDLLAVLDQEDLDATEDRIQGELNAAQAVLEELVAGPREQTIAAARARVEELAAKVELAKIDAQRQKQLAPQGATSRSELDRATFGLQAVENNLRAAQALLGELSEGTRKEQIAAQQAKCAAIQASLREIESRRNDSRIESPFDGHVDVRAIDEGVVVATGQVVLTLVSTTLEAQIGLPPAVAKRLHPNDQVNVLMNGNQRRAWVDRLEPTVRKDTRTRVVYLRFSPSAQQDDPAIENEMLRAGWVAGDVIELELPETDRETSQSEQSFWLPRSSLIRGARGLWTVLVVPGDSGAGVCERRAVEVLKTDGSAALVQGMVQRNERVVSTGLHRITAGMLVTDAGTTHQSDPPASDGSDE